MKPSICGNKRIYFPKWTLCDCGDSICPASIEMVTLPSKLIYENNELINFSGMVVRGLDRAGEVWETPNYPNGIIPIYDLTLPVRRACRCGGDAQDFSNLTEWDRYEIAASEITYSDGISTMNHRMITGDYERVFKRVEVEPNTDYVFSATLNVLQFPSGHNAGDGTYIGVLSQTYGSYIEANTSYLIARAVADSSGTVIVPFNSGERSVVYLYIDWADITDGQTAVIEYSDIKFSGGATEQTIPVQFDCDSLLETSFNITVTA